MKNVQNAFFIKIIIKTLKTCFTSFILATVSSLFRNRGHPFMLPCVKSKLLKTSPLKDSQLVTYLLTYLLTYLT